jgi:membrane fusion protein YbhG
MSHSPLRVIIPAVLVLALAAGGLYVLNAPPSAEAATISASGVIEADEVSISPEISGRVVEVMVDKGDAVAAGDPLFRFDNQTLQLQRQQTVTAGASAAADAQVALLAAQKALRDLNDQAEMSTAQAALDLANARKALDDAMRHRSWQQTGNRASREAIDGLQAQLTLADKAVSDAEHAVNSLKDRPTDDPQRAAAEANLYNVRHQRDLVKANLNWATGSPTNLDQAVLDAQVGVAQAEVDQAQTQFDRVKVGPDPADLAMAQAQVDSAHAALAAAQASTQAQVAAIDLQLEKLIVRAPSAGVVLTRSVEPGEVVQAGLTVLSLGDLQSLRVKVYIPEDRYGQIGLGDHASLAVDSFPGKSFDGVVTAISDQAEFTPRNVQTKDVRQTTVYGVELSIRSGQGRLIPGMPTDVTFVLPPSG